MIPHQIVRIPLVLASFVLATIGGAQPAEQVDYESAVNVRYQGQYTPDHFAFESVLSWVANTEREKAAHAIYFELNSVQNEMGAWTWAENREYDLAIAETIVDELLAVRTSIEEQKKQITQETVCPRDRPYPADDAAHIALDAQRARSETALLAAYRSFRGNQSKEVAERFDEWLEDWKAGYSYVAYDLRKLYELTGDDINDHINQFCDSFNSQGSGE